MPHPHETCDGPIQGLCLPAFAWAVLDQQNIWTMDQLKAKAAQPEWFDRMGSEMTRVIKAGLDRATPLQNQVSSGRWLRSPWSA